MRAIFFLKLAIWLHVALTLPQNLSQRLCLLLFFTSFIFNSVLITVNIIFPFQCTNMKNPQYKFSEYGGIFQLISYDASILTAIRMTLLDWYIWTPLYTESLRQVCLTYACLYTVKLFTFDALCNIIKINRMLFIRSLANSGNQRFTLELFFASEFV